MLKIFATAALATALLASGAYAPEAISAYERAIGLERDPAVRVFLHERKAALVM